MMMHLPGSMPPRPRRYDPREVKLAGQVQKLLLPKSPPSLSWCSMSAKNRMADVLGGDFYDFIELENAFRRLDGDREITLERLFTEIGNFLAGESPLDDCTAIVVDLHADSSTACAGGK